MRRSPPLPWRRALVTGASAGIGRAMAVQLADAGVDVVLVSRNAARLQELAQQLHGSGATVDVLAADLTSSEGLAAIKQRVSATADPVDLLVNNAGLGYEGPFHSQPEARIRETIDLNLVALVELTHAALGAMVARGDGQVMLVSSMASLQGLPMTAAYAASKAFVTSLGEGLVEELRGTGVGVTTVLPGLTHTEFHDRNDWDLQRWPSFGWLEADEVAAEALAAAARHQPWRVTGRLNKFLSLLSTLSPRGLRRRILGISARRSMRSDG